MRRLLALLTPLLLAGAAASGAELQSNAANAVTKVRVQDWAVLCQATAAQPTALCVAYTQNGGETVKGTVAVRLSIQRRGGGHSVFLDVTPALAGDLSFSLRIDDNKPLIGQAQSCEATRCRIVISGDQAAALIAQFKPGRSAAFGFVGDDGTPILVRLSLRGFTATLSALNKTG